MTDEPNKLPKAFWQIPAWILLLIAIGNGIMLITLQGAPYTIDMFSWPHSIQCLLAARL